MYICALFVNISKKTFSMKIKDAQIAIYGKPGRGLEKRISRLGGVPHGAGDAYTDAIADALGLPKPGELAKSKPLPPPAKVRTQNLAATAPPVIRVSVPDAPTVQTSPIKMVFENQILFLVMLLLICVIDGLAMGLIGLRVYQGGMLSQAGMSVAGVIVAYAGIQNAYTLSKQPRKEWETNPAAGWLVVFAIYQIILHGAAGGFFSSWNHLISQILLATGVPMAGGALSVLLFKSPKTDTK